MIVSRMDLDGAGSPQALVAKILKHEPGLVAPVPIEDLAAQLDIAEIRDLSTEGFEGGLITDAGRSSGFILVNRGAPRARRRFTIGHELGHFLMTHHKPPPGGFQCSREDMIRQAAKEQDAYGQMEVEANQFSALILMPPPLLRPVMARFKEGDLVHILELARHFDVSREAAARNYALFHEEKLAVLVVKDGKILRVYRNPKFPWMCVKAGSAVPQGSLYHRPGHQQNVASAVAEARPEVWLDSNWGQRMSELSEQVYLQRDGYALIMLWAQVEEEEDRDPDEDRTSKQRYQDQHARRCG